MPNVLNAAGLTTSSYDEVLSYLTQSLQIIYGSDIDLSSNTPDGQWVNIIIQLVLDLQNLLSQIYSSIDPDNAIGVQLDQRCAINGVKRQAGTYSTTDITIVLTQTIPLFGLDQATQPVYTVADNVGNQWELLQTQINVGPGTVVYSFQSATPGANQTIPNTITVPVTVVLGVSSVNNPTGQSIIGLDSESDLSLRLRRSRSVAVSSKGYLQGLYAALNDINGIASAFVYENDTDETDGNGVPGHSIWVIVDGTLTVNPQQLWDSTTIYLYGDIVSSAGINYISWRNNNLNHAVSDTFYWGIYNPVAQVIYAKRNAGCGLFGQTEYNITQIDATEFTVLWDIVEDQNLFITFIATSIDGINPPNIAGIIAGLVANYIFAVNEEININQMATIVQKTDSNCLVTTAGLSLAKTQVATLSGVAASGTFKFGYNGNLTASINWDDSAGTIQTKLRTVTGLSSLVVAGSIASQTLTLSLNVDSVLSLITVTNNSLVTSGPVAITFSFNEGYSNILSPSTKKNKFVLSSSDIIILPMILSPISVNVVALATQQFTGLGGYGILVYSMQANPSGGTINSSTGLYTAGSTPASDVAKVTDAFGNTATATITVN